MNKESFVDLSLAIVYRACLDYENQLVAYYSETNDKEKAYRLKLVKEIQNFFGSPWYYMLTNIDHNKVMRYLEERAKLKANKK